MDKRDDVSADYFELAYAERVWLCRRYLKGEDHCDGSGKPLADDYP